MVEWSREYYIDPSTTGLNAVYRSVNGEGENNVDGAAITESQEVPSGLLSASGRQFRGSFQALKSELSEYILLLRIKVLIVCLLSPCVCVCGIAEGDTASVASMDNPEQFESKKQLKETMEQGIRL